MSEFHQEWPLLMKLHGVAEGTNHDAVDSADIIIRGFFPLVKADDGKSNK
ncbi:hypothetical protein [Dysosmobacter sp. HCP28S3_G4]